MTDSSREIAAIFASWRRNDGGPDPRTLTASRHIALIYRGRWYITQGRPGFNSRANNGQGYTSEAAAIAASRKFARSFTAAQRASR